MDTVVIQSSLTESSAAVCENSRNQRGDYFSINDCLAHLSLSTCLFPCVVIETELLEEEAEMTQAAGEAGKLGGLRRRRRTLSRNLADHGKPSKRYGQDPEHRDRSLGAADTTGPHRWSTTAIVASMSVILLVLIVLNLGLFFKLWAMENVAQRMYLTTKHRLRERMETSFGSQYGSKPGPVVRTNEDLHLLKTVLQDSIHLLEQ
ncbi:hypothetical protein AMECASPLE_037414, partial [Ameca splendens]